jgi:1-deoxy-D-xylulose-5-phosphate reductoisomerase
MKKISILGVTGWIGKSTLKILDFFSNDLELIAISTNKQIKSLLHIIDKYKPKYAVVVDSNIMYEYFHQYEINYNGTFIYSGNEGLKKICSDSENEIIINGISGIAGLIPSLLILEHGINLALANKESMVCAGPILNAMARKNSCHIIPVDSEHSAIFQLLNNNNRKNINNLYLTASGGPFLKLDKKEWNNITREEALNHPTWKMGHKITIDSATMANKGLEVIEAHQLFGFDYDNIKVLVHPQSLIHSMVECIDGEIYAQIGPNDMSIPIQNAIFYPEIKGNLYNRFDFTKMIKLEILPIDFEKFRMLELAYFCGKKGGLYPAFFNSTNDYLVEMFLNNKISFIDIINNTETAVEHFEKDKEVEKKEMNLENIKKVTERSKSILKIICNF